MRKGRPPAGGASWKAPAAVTSELTPERSEATRGLAPGPALKWGHPCVLETGRRLGQGEPGDGELDSERWGWAQ